MTSKKPTKLIINKKGAKLIINKEGGIIKEKRRLINQKIKEIFNLKIKIRTEIMDKEDEITNLENELKNVDEVLPERESEKKYIIHTYGYRSKQYTIAKSTNFDPNWDTITNGVAGYIEKDIIWENFNE
tara:strand:+ start:364 stop:750 length:387 start_codon:yes stop_codon:yes gene_type:complete